MMPPTTTSSSSIDATCDQLDSIRVRIVSVGDIGVGKSCLIKKYCEPDKFVKTHVPTVGVDYGSKLASATRTEKSLDKRIDFFDLSGNMIRTSLPPFHPVLWMLLTSDSIHQILHRRSCIFRGAERVLQEQCQRDSLRLRRNERKDL